MVGIERETFLSDKNGKISAVSAKMLDILGKGDRFTHDLPACQLEDRIGPVPLYLVINELRHNDICIQKAQEITGFGRIHYEVGPLDTPTEVSPDPTGRYQEIANNIHPDTLLSACRVIGTHIHIGMPDHETALHVYNHAIRFVGLLSDLGDGSGGERLRIYKEMARDSTPPRYKSWEDFYRVAVEKGFEKDPRKCWHFIRMSIHGTIEFRMFGTTPDINKVHGWAKKCLDICVEVME